MPNGTTIEKPNSQTAENIMASTILPQQGGDLLRTPRTIISQNEALRDFNNITNEEQNISAGMTGQAEAVAQRQAQPDISVVDYLNSQGQSSSFTERERLAEQYGISNYTGTAAQNTRLLNILKNQPPTPEPSPDDRRTEALGGAITDAIGEGEAPSPEDIIAEKNNRIADIISQGFYTPQSILNQLGDDFTFSEIETYLSENPLTLAQQLGSRLQTELDDLDREYEDYKSQIDQIRSGAFPLSPEEQGQIDTINRIFDELKAQQITANKNYEAGINILGITEGRQRYAPRRHLDNIKSAVDEGIKKVSEIDAKRVSMVNELKLAIRDKQYTRANDAYDRFRQYTIDKMNTLQGIYDVAKAEQEKIDSFISEQNKLIQEENQRVQEEIERILEEATGNLAPQEIIYNIMNAKTIEDAIASAGSYLQTGTGDVGEYLFYKRQRELQGLPVIDFITYQRTSKATTKTERDKSLRMEALKKAREELTKSLKRKPAVGVSIFPELDISKEYAPSDLYLQLRTDYSTLIGDPDEFDDVFSYLLSPTDRKKYGIGFLKTEETFSSQLELVRQTLQNYVDKGYSRKEVEEEYMISNGVSEIPPSIEKILDELYD